MAETVLPTPATDVRLETMVERLRRRARLVLALRLAVLVFLVGGWELGVRAGLIDPFFFGQPSGIVEKLIDWFQNGTSSTCQLVRKFHVPTTLNFFSSICACADPLAKST